jgi:hypothetical protein
MPCVLSAQFPTNLTKSRGRNTLKRANSFFPIFLGVIVLLAVPVSAQDVVVHEGLPAIRRLDLRGRSGHYTLNGVELRRVSGHSIELTTGDQSVRVRAVLLKTVPLSLGKAVSPGDNSLVEVLIKDVPLVAEILKQRDPIASLKPVVYQLLQPTKRMGLYLREELVFLWSADPDEVQKVGDTTLMPPIPFDASQIVDVQYRGLRQAADRLIGKILLQILYVENRERRAALGAFIIVSRPHGEFEFYSLPRVGLDQILIRPTLGPVESK